MLLAAAIPDLTGQQWYPRFVDARPSAVGDEQCELMQTIAKAETRVAGLRRFAALPPDTVAAVKDEASAMGRLAYEALEGNAARIADALQRAIDRAKRDAEAAHWQVIREAHDRLNRVVAQEPLCDACHWLDFHLCPGKYARPEGVVLIGRTANEAVGIVAYRPLEHRICEMKRLYVVPRFRGTGLGRLLVEELVRDARSHGYRRMVLDTLPSMRSAQALYSAMGFRPIPAYYYNPLPRVINMALEL